MKKLFIILSFILLSLSCKKEDLPPCGQIIAKELSYYNKSLRPIKYTVAYRFKIRNTDSSVKLIGVSADDYYKYNLNDTYCYE